MELNDSEKQSYMRWLNDLMKADKIIAPDEIDFIENECQRLSISLQDIEKSTTLSLEASLEILKRARKQTRLYVINQIRNLSLSDGACSREEALLLIALHYGLNSSTRNICSIASFKSPDIDFIDSQILFIENHEDPYLNKEIRRRYRSIVNEMRIGGFEFIYIPHIANMYRETDRNLLRRIVSYLSPTLTDDETEKVLLELSTLSTHNFLRGIMRDKLNIEVSISRPSLMIKIGNSYVNGVRMSDFLILEVSNNIVEEVQRLVETFLDLQSSTIITLKNYIESERSFIYTGFYKTIFDIVTYRKGARYSLVFNHGSNERLKIRGAEEVSLDIGLAATAFYEFLIQESFKEQRGVNFANIGVKTQQEIKKQFAEIYNKYRGHRNEVPDICSVVTRNPLLSRIRNAIRQCEELTEKHSYLPSVVSSKVYVPVDKHLILIE